MTLRTEVTFRLLTPQMKRAGAAVSAAQVAKFSTGQTPHQDLVGLKVEGVKFN